MLAAPSGEGALVMVRREAIDVVLLDMIMPAGMHGRETLALLHRARPTLPCLVVRGFAASADVRHALASGHCLFLAKPHTLEDLGRALQRLLR